MKSPGRFAAALPWLAWVHALLLFAMLAYAAALVPVAFGDQFEEILDVQQYGLIELLAERSFASNIYFRPFESFWRELIFALFGQRLFSYNLFQIVLLAIGVGLFAGFCRAANGRDAVAAMIALSCLLGHHAFVASMELNHVVSALPIMVMLLAGLHILESSGGTASGVLAFTLSLLALLTKELGVAVPLLFLMGWQLGFGGVRTRAALAIGILLAGYLAFRFYVLFALGEIADASYGGEDKSLTAYARNVAATLLNIVTSEPKRGDFATVPQALAIAGDAPWKLLQIAAPASVFALIAYVAVTQSRAQGGAQRGPRGRRHEESDERLRRWLLLLAGSLAIASLLGFHHSSEFHGITVLPVLAAVLFLSLRRVMAEVESGTLSRGLRLAVLCLLLVTSAGWSLRAASAFFVLRSKGALVQRQWVHRYEDFSRRVQGDDAKIGLQRFRDVAVGIPVATELDDPPVLQWLFGGENSVR